MAGGEIQLVELTKEFSDVRAVDGINVEIDRGEFFSLLGPSGCGKTTTLRLVAGFEEPTSGSILLEGADVAHLPAHKRNVNTVFQSYALFPFLTVAENVGFGLKYKSVSKQESARRVGEALELVQLTGYEKRRPGQLSGGQQQRVALARALVLNPAVLLLDEPLGALDAKLRRTLQIELKALQERVGITFIYVTHDQEEALSLADRIVVMRDGTAQQIGVPEDLYARPANPDVAEFMGYRNMIRATARPSVAGVPTGVIVTIAGAELPGTAVGETFSGPAIVAIRPDDLAPAADGPIAATVESAEYHGRDFACIARAADGTELHFRAHARVQPGEAIRLGVPAQRVLVYPA